MDILQQDEIDRLLSAVNTEPAGPPKPRPPDVFTREHMIAFSRIHEQFSFAFTNILSSAFKVPVDIDVASVDQLMYQEFIRSIPSPSIMITLDLQGLNSANEADAKLVWEIDPAIYNVLVYLREDKKYNLPFKEYNFHGQYLHAIMAVIKQYALDPLADSWEKAVKLKPKFAKIETDPNMVNIAAPDEMVLLVTLSTDIADPRDTRHWIEGMMNICIPASALKPVLEKLSTVNLDAEHARYKTWKDKVYKTKYKDNPGVLTMDQVMALLQSVNQNYKPGVPINEQADSIIDKISPPLTDPARNDDL